MPYRRMLLDSKNSDRIFEESSLENLKMEDVFIVVSKVFSLHEDPQDLCCYFSKEHSGEPQVVLLVHSSSDKTQEKNLSQLSTHWSYK